ncbi:hypothetical protein BZG76_06955 [Salinivibrio sp. AR647]|nr:hypothetical protein BZG76_06955 [Salinivibrio sp. AR647]OOE92658.1 hypothetical protein BZG75_08775 [Salinivibrio sp. AR640]
MAVINDFVIGLTQGQIVVDSLTFIRLCGVPKLKHVMLMLLTVALVSGCQLTRVEGELDNVEVKVNSKDSETRSSGKFCPPGHAKQGKC